MYSIDKSILEKVNKQITQHMLDVADSDFDVKLEVSKESILEVKKLFKDFYVMFSGGKDSLVVLDLIISLFGTENLYVVYIEIPGNTHELNIQYTYNVIKKYKIPMEKFLHLKSEHDFYELVKKWGWPGPRRRWCMTTFKKQVINKHLKGKLSVTGVKAFDSGWRKKWVRAGALGVIPGWKTIYFKPIFHWNDNDVKEYINKYIKVKGIDLNPLYNIIGGSANCVYCPYNSNPTYYIRLFINYPHWAQKLFEAQNKVRKGAPFLNGKGKVYFEDIIKKGIELRENKCEGIELGLCGI